MDYKQRLILAAKCVYDGELRATGESRVDSSDFGIQATLKPHQVEGVSWLIRRYHLGVNVILGDEMGLGKTLQAVTLLSYLKVCLKFSGPFLVLCPLSVTDGWVSEVANFAPKLRLLRYVGDKEYRCKLRREMSEYVKESSFSSHVPSLPFDVLLTTYDIALIDQDFLSQFPWHYAIIDEAQRLKNPSSVLYTILRERFVIPRKLLLTGTPVQNNLTELWALMHFCMPLIFGTLEQFLSYFKEAGDPSSGQGALKVKEQFEILKYVLGAFMLRRTKSALMESGTLMLPPVTEITVMAPLSPLQKKVYMSILRKELPKLLALASRGTNAPSLHNIVIQLRKACSHPYLFPGIEPEPYQEGEHLVQVSGKLLILDQLLMKLHDSGHRVLLFAQMTHTLDIIQDFLEMRKYTYERLDGSIRAEERFAAIRNFSINSSANINTHQSTPFVFLISTRAGGVGLNLVAADTVIFYEQDWNPQVDKQALQRAHRIGQSNHVLCINLVTGRTVEEVIMRRARRKLQLSHNVIGDEMLDREGSYGGTEAGDLKSVIFGLHVFGPMEMDTEKSDDQLDKSELAVLAEKVIASRHELQSDVRDRKLEINSMNRVNDQDLVKQDASESMDFDPGLDEASYMSWVEKFKQPSPEQDSDVLELGNKRCLPDEKHIKAEAARRKAEEKKILKWETLGYHSLSVSNPVIPVNQDVMSDAGSVHFVYGDCTTTAAVTPSESTIIFSCVDNSGNWGHGGLFDALARLSASIPSAYQRASEFGDLHLGDLHLIEITEDHGELRTPTDLRQWVGLAVVQSYNQRRKVPRGDISMADLEVCLAKASFSAAQYSASIHMPRVNYQHGTDRSEWYTVERLLRKYAAMYGINIYV
ncbi:probable helicase CHR10 isoform X3 [Salvia miltiorrhiza]|uniref:probable helicase CHR10 isoform X3 n=1 Tax=Salvia miltiorrhiza TaxID=226208 RepID=UPI0025AD4DBE|nr:probable helicase CHR10 isoform X3 [Salvia miltiorrhiza]